MLCFENNIPDDDYDDSSSLLYCSDGTTFLFLADRVSGKAYTLVGLRNARAIFMWRLSWLIGQWNAECGTHGDSDVGAALDGAMR